MQVQQGQLQRKFRQQDLDAQESTKSSKKDLAAFIKKAVSQGVRRELNSIDKKRKGDDLDLNAIDMDLNGFNYEDMDNLKIDSDDESVSEVSC